MPKNQLPLDQGLFWYTNFAQDITPSVCILTALKYKCINSVLFLYETGIYFHYVIYGQFKF